MLYITGATGHSGQWFLRHLAMEKYNGEVRCVIRANSDTQYIDESVLNIEKVCGNLDDEEFLLKTMRGVDTVVHIASIFFSERIVECAIKCSVKWVILVHTTGRFSKYKSASEEYIKIEDGLLAKREKIGITVLRPTMIYGSSRDRNMYKLVDFLYRHRLFPIFGKGENLMQPVHAKDLGKAYYDVLTHSDVTFNKQYDLPGKKAIPYIALVRCVSRAVGGNNVIVKIPLWLSIVGAKVYNFFCKNTLISVEQVLRMQEDKAFSYEMAAQDFGYAPQSFEEGIRGEVAEYLHNLKKRC